MKSSVNGRFSFCNEPVINLKELIYGQRLPRRNAHPRLGLNDKDCTEMPINSTQENLLGRQDAYIEQLESENTTLKVELKEIRGIVQEVVQENQVLIQRYDAPSNLLSGLSNPSYNPADTKGLSDEEKMSGGQKTKMKEGFQKPPPSNIETYANAKDTADQTYAIIRLRKDTEDMAAIIGQLGRTVDDMRTREEAARKQIKQGIALLEQAQYEKIQALVERDKLKEENETYQMRIAQLTKQFEDKLEVAEETILMLNKKKYEEDELNLKEVRCELTATRNSLDKAERQNSDLKQRLRKAEARLEACHGDMQQMAEKMQEETTKALSERDIAVRDQAQMKVKCDRAKLEQEKELLLTKMESRKLRKRTEQVEETQVATKSELLRLSERNRTLEKKIEWSERWANQEIRARDEELSRILNLVKSEKEKQGQLLNKQGERHAELVRMIVIQRNLLNKYKAECQQLGERVACMEEQHRRVV